MPIKAHKHDCNACEFVGMIMKEEFPDRLTSHADVYSHNDTVIIRLSGYGPNYLSASEDIARRIADQTRDPLWSAALSLLDEFRQYAEAPSP